MELDRDIMRGQFGTEGEQTLRRKYPRNPDQPQPPIQFNIQDADGGVYEEDAPQSSQPPAPAMQNPYAPAPTVPAQAAPYQALYPEDEPIFPGGPYESEIISWKKQFGDIFMLEIGTEVFIFRTLNRFEYKQIMAVPNTDPLMREELISETCVLWPRDLNYQTMSGGKAGVPAMLSENILDKSAFTRNTVVRAL